MTNSRFVFGSLIFAFFLSVILSEVTGTTYNFISPITLTIISTPLIAVITASNTPIVKGTALAVFFGVITTFIILSDIPLYVFGLIIVPLFISVGLSFAEIGGS